MNTQTPPDQQNQYLIEQARIAADAGDFVLSMSFRKKIIYPVDTLLYAKATQGAAWVRAYMNTAPAEEVYGVNWLEEVSAAEAGLFGSYTVVNLKEGPA